MIRQFASHAQQNVEPALNAIAGMITRIIYGLSWDEIGIFDTIRMFFGGLQIGTLLLLFQFVSLPLEQRLAQPGIHAVLPPTLLNQVGDASTSMQRQAVVLQ